MHLLMVINTFLESNGSFLMAAGRYALNESIDLLIDLIDFIELFAAVHVIPISAFLHIDKAFSLPLLGLQLLYKSHCTLSLSSSNLFLSEKAGSPYLFALPRPNVSSNMLLLSASSDWKNDFCILTLNNL